MRILKNPTDKDAEFMFGGATYVVKAGEAKSFDDAVVRHYVNYVSGPLVEEPVEEPMVDVMNTTDEDKAFQGVVIKAGEVVELPKSQAKAFIRAVDGVDWPRGRGKKKAPEVSVRVGQKGPEA